MTGCYRVWPCLKIFLMSICVFPINELYITYYESESCMCLPRYIRRLVRAKRVERKTGGEKYEMASNESGGLRVL